MDRKDSCASGTLWLEDFDIYRLYIGFCALSLHIIYSLLYYYINLYWFTYNIVYVSIYIVYVSFYLQN